MPWRLRDVSEVLRRLGDPISRCVKDQKQIVDVTQIGQRKDAYR